MGRNTVALFIKLKSAGATPKIAQPFVIETAVSMIYERISRDAEKFASTASVA